MNMERRTFIWRPLSTAARRWFALLSLLLAVAVAEASQDLTQIVRLQPGWNSVWLEVDPPDRTPAAVFAGLPLASVWTWSERISATDFIQNPETAGWNRARWLAFFPTNSAEARLANLYAVLPQRAYLIRIAGTNAADWSVTGRPILQTPAWVADRFNLRGFPVDPAMRPTFRQFFRSSPAHFHPATGRLESVLRLNPDGQWQPVAPDEPMRRGEAYWVYTRGPSEFIAPFSLGLNSGEAIDFDAATRRVELTLRNPHSTDKLVHIEPVGPQASPLLLLPEPVPGQTNDARPLVTHDQPVAAGKEQRLRLGLDRTQLADSPATDPNTGVHGNLLRISDGEGTLYYVGVVALTAGASDFTGLWLGTVTITNVSPTMGKTNGPGAVALGFPLRLLLHVDSGGQVSLLRDVTLVYTRTNAAPVTNGAVSGRGLSPAQLITDPARLVGYSAGDLRSRQVIGRRLTAPHFEFARSNGQFELPLQGVFAVSNVVTGTLRLPGDLPTNPFRHRYHPDHATNAYTVVREINMRFGANPNISPGEGDAALGGTYWETINGLHKLPLQVSGSLELRRISRLGALNAP